MVAAKAGLQYIISKLPRTVQLGFIHSFVLYLFTHKTDMNV